LRERRCAGVTVATGPREAHPTCATSPSGAGVLQANDGPIQLADHPVELCTDLPVDLPPAAA